MEISQQCIVELQKKNVTRSPNSINENQVKMYVSMATLMPRLQEDLKTVPVLSTNMNSGDGSEIDI